MYIFVLNSNLLKLLKTALPIYDLRCLETQKEKVNYLIISHFNLTLHLNNYYLNPYFLHVTHSNMTIIPFIFIAASDPGFIHSLSPLKKGKSGREYYTFNLQTSPSKFTKVVGFDRSSHEKALHFQNTGTPTKLLSPNDKDGQLFVNEYTTLVKANPSDVNFESNETACTSDQSNLPTTNAIDITLDQLPTLTRNQKVNVKAKITMGSAEPKQVTKRNGQKGLVKEDCIIEDATGHATIHLWDDMITRCNNSTAYEIKNLSVKNYSGNTHLGTTATTAIEEIEIEIDNIQGPGLLNNLQQTITVEEFLFADKVNIFMTCQIKSCNKKMPYSVGNTVFTCPYCRASQKVKAAKKGISARLCINLDGKQVWLTALTDIMQGLLTKLNLTMDDKSDEIKEALLTLENITFVIDSVSNFILEIKE